MLKKLRSKKGMTMSLSIVLAVVITAVSLSVSALVATVSINQVNTAKAKYETLVLENKLYDFMNDYYEKKEDEKYQLKVLYEKSPDASLLDEEKFRFKVLKLYIQAYVAAYCDYYQNNSGGHLTRSGGVFYGPSGKETYYNLNMSGVVSIMRSIGNNDEYWVREDGCKMLGNYIMVAADLNVHPRGSLVPTSLGMGIVCDTGGFVSNGSGVALDIATAWQKIIMENTKKYSPFFDFYKNL